MVSFPPSPLSSFSSFSSNIVNQEIRAQESVELSQTPVIVPAEFSDRTSAEEGRDSSTCLSSATPEDDILMSAGDIEIGRQMLVTGLRDMTAEIRPNIILHHPEQRNASTTPMAITSRWGIQERFHLFTGFTGLHEDGEGHASGKGSEGDADETEDIAMDMELSQQVLFRI